MEDRDKIIKGLELAYLKLIEYKKYKKTPLIVYRRGKIVEIAPEKILPTTIQNQHITTITKNGKNNTLHQRIPNRNIRSNKTLLQRMPHKRNLTKIRAITSS